MSYAIIRNEKLTRAKAMGAYKHNERKTKNHSNKNIVIAVNKKPIKVPDI